MTNREYNELEIGDELIVVEDMSSLFSGELFATKGERSFVVSKGNKIAIKFDSKLRIRHDCDGICEDEQGLWLSKSMIHKFKVLTNED